MGNEHYIVDRMGFKINDSDENKILILETLYHAMGEDNRKRILEDIENENDRNIAYRLFDNIKKLDDAIQCGISDQCMAQLPIYIGWSCFDIPIEKQNMLKKIFEKESFKVENIEKNRYVTYG